MSSSVPDAPSPPDTPNRPPPPNDAEIAESARRFYPAQPARPAQEAMTDTAISESARRFEAAREDAKTRGAAIEAKPTPIPVSAPVVTRPDSATPEPARSTMPAIPPARIAMVAGDVNAKPDYDMGRSQNTGAPPAVVPVLARAGDSAMASMAGGLRIGAARQMDAGTANATLNAMTANLRHWAADFPHKAVGDGAVLLKTVRELIQTDQRRRDAAAYGQTDFIDPTADVTHEPPPESMLLGQLKGQTAAVLTIFEKIMGAANLRLTQPDQDAVDTLKGMIDQPVV